MSKENTTNVVKEKMDLYVQKLINELQQGHSESFKEYLKVASKFHKYSWNNQMLIACQKPEATRVAGFHTWKKLGRHVKEGSKSIKILAPVFSKKTVEEDGKEKEKEVVWWKTVSVFDISDTEGKELPNWHTELGSDSLDIYGRLKTALIERGFKVDECKISGGALGVCYSGKRIEIEESLDPMNKALTLIHEAAHGLLNHCEKPELTKTDKEAQAEAATYIVASFFDQDSPISADYLISWKVDEAKLKENLSAVIKVSQEIIEILSNEKGNVKEKTVSDENAAA